MKQGEVERVSCGVNDTSKLYLKGEVLFRFQQFLRLVHGVKVVEVVGERFYS